MSKPKYGGSGGKRTSAVKFQENLYRSMKVGPSDPLGTSIKLPLFSTIEEVESFLGKGEIRCPICGRTYKNLGLHLWQKHELSAEEFKERTGIPQNRGLVCPSTREKNVAVARRNLSEGKFGFEKGVLPPTTVGGRRKHTPSWYAMQGDKARKVPKGFRKETLAKIEDIKRRLLRGEVKKHIVDELGVSWRVLLRGEKELAGEARYFPRHKRGENLDTPAKLEEIKSRFLRGESKSHIMREMKVSFATIYRAVGKTAKNNKKANH